LKLEYYQTYANYIRKFLDAYKERGINIWGLITTHEPTIGFTPGWYNAMGWTPNASVFWVVNYVFPILSKAGYDPVYIAYDDERNNLQWYVDDMFSNEKADKLYTGISVHWYEDTEVSPMILTETHDKYPNKFIMMTEACFGNHS
jgi:glucosylceramidase